MVLLCVAVLLAVFSVVSMWGGTAVPVGVLMLVASLALLRVAVKRLLRGDW